MYQALYRVWRPKTFSQMVGQEAIVNTLKHQVMTGRIAHAYLFCGSRGTGKTSAAKIMARAINCMDNKQGDPCLECESCKTIEQNASFDVFEMDAASNSRVEEIRELLDKVDYPPQFGKYKVYIIDEVHMLSNAAFNALLKTLEEPPSYMVFILATTEPQKLPATILSRCQRFDFGRFTEKELVGRMKETTASLEQKISDDAYLLIAQSAEGGMRDALSLLDMCLGTGQDITEDSVRKVLGAADKTLLFDFAQKIIEGNTGDVLTLVDDVVQKGYDVQVFLKDLSRHFRFLLTFKLCEKGENNMLSITHESAERYRQQAKLCSSQRMLRVLDLIMHAEADTRFQMSAKTVLTVCALKAAQEAEEENISGLLERINELEIKLSNIKQGGFVPVKTQENAPKAENKANDGTQPVIVDNVQKGERLPKDVWNDAIKIVKKENPRLAIGLGKFAGYNNGVYRLRFSKEDDMWVQLLNDPARREVVEEALLRSGATSAHFEAVSENAVIDVSKQKKAEEALEALSDTFGRENIIVND